LSINNKKKNLHRLASTQTDHTLLYFLILDFLFS